MPQLKVFGRRWRLASDMLPAMGIFFIVIHACVLIPVFIVFVAGTGGYECSQETKVRSDGFLIQNDTCT